MARKRTGPRVVICDGKPGKKVQVRYPAMTGGYITYTYCSIASAKRGIADLIPWQKRRAKIIRL